MLDRNSIVHILPEDVEMFPEEVQVESCPLILPLVLTRRRVHSLAVAHTIEDSCSEGYQTPSITSDMLSNSFTCSKNGDSGSQFSADSNVISVSPHESSPCYTTGENYLQNSLFSDPELNESSIQDSQAGSVSPELAEFSSMVSSYNSAFCQRAPTAYAGHRDEQGITKSLRLDEEKSIDQPISLLQLTGHFTEANLTGKSTYNHTKNQFRQYSEDPSYLETLAEIKKHHLDLAHNDTWEVNVKTSIDELFPALPSNIQTLLGSSKQEKTRVNLRRRNSHPSPVVKFDVSRVGRNQHPTKRTTNKHDKIRPATPTRSSFYTDLSLVQGHQDSRTLYKRDSSNETNTSAEGSCTFEENSQQYEGSFASSYLEKSDINVVSDSNASPRQEFSRDYEYKMSFVSHGSSEDCDSSQTGESCSSNSYTGSIDTEGSSQGSTGHLSNKLDSSPVDEFGAISSVEFSLAKNAEDLLCSRNEKRKESLEELLRTKQELVENVYPDISDPYMFSIHADEKSVFQQSLGSRSEDGIAYDIASPKLASRERGLESGSSPVFISGNDASLGTGSFHVSSCSAQYIARASEPISLHFTETSGGCRMSNPESSDSHINSSSYSLKEPYNKEYTQVNKREYDSYRSGNESQKDEHSANDFSITYTDPPFEQSLFTRERISEGSATSSYFYTGDNVDTAYHTESKASLANYLPTGNVSKATQNPEKHGMPIAYGDLIQSYISQNTYECEGSKSLGESSSSPRLNAVISYEENDENLPVEYNHGSKVYHAPSQYETALENYNSAEYSVDYEQELEKAGFGIPDLNHPATPAFYNEDVNAEELEDNSQWRNSSFGGEWTENAALWNANNPENALQVIEDPTFLEDYTAIYPNSANVKPSDPVEPVIPETNQRLESEGPLFVYDQSYTYYFPRGVTDKVCGQRNSTIKMRQPDVLDNAMADISALNSAVAAICGDSKSQLSELHVRAKGCAPGVDMKKLRCRSEPIISMPRNKSKSRRRSCPARVSHEVTLVSRRIDYKNPPLPSEALKLPGSPQSKLDKWLQQYTGDRFKSDSSTVIDGGLESIDSSTWDPDYNKVYNTLEHSIKQPHMKFYALGNGWDTLSFAQWSTHDNESDSWGLVDEEDESFTGNNQRRYRNKKYGKGNKSDNHDTSCEVLAQNSILQMQQGAEAASIRGSATNEVYQGFAKAHAGLSELQDRETWKRHNHSSNDNRHAHKKTKSQGLVSTGIGSNMEMKNDEFRLISHKKGADEFNTETRILDYETKKHALRDPSESTDDTRLGGAVTRVGQRQEPGKPLPIAEYKPLESGQAGQEATLQNWVQHWTADPYLPVCSPAEKARSQFPPADEVDVLEAKAHDIYKDEGIISEALGLNSQQIGDGVSMPHGEINELVEHGLHKDDSSVRQRTMPVQTVFQFLVVRQKDGAFLLQKKLSPSGDPWRVVPSALVDSEAPLDISFDRALHSLSEKFKFTPQVKGLLATSSLNSGDHGTLLIYTMLIAAHSCRSHKNWLRVSPSDRPQNIGSPTCSLSEAAHRAVWWTQWIVRGGGATLATPFVLSTKENSELSKSTSSFLGVIVFVLLVLPNSAVLVHSKTDKVEPEEHSENTWNAKMLQDIMPIFKCQSLDAAVSRTKKFAQGLSVLCSGARAVAMQRVSIEKNVGIRVLVRANVTSYDDSSLLAANAKSLLPFFPKELSDLFIGESEVRQRRTRHWVSKGKLPEPRSRLLKDSRPSSRWWGGNVVEYSEKAPEGDVGKTVQSIGSISRHQNEAKSLDEKKNDVSKTKEDLSRTRAFDQSSISRSNYFESQDESDKDGGYKNRSTTYARVSKSEDQQGTAASPSPVSMDKKAEEKQRSHGVQKEGGSVYPKTNFSHDSDPAFQKDSAHGRGNVISKTQTSAIKETRFSKPSHHLDLNFSFDKAGNIAGSMKSSKIQSNLIKTEEKKSAVSKRSITNAPGALSTQNASSFIAADNLIKPTNLNKDSAFKQVKSGHENFDKNSFNLTVTSEGPVKKAKNIASSFTIGNNSQKMMDVSKLSLSSSTDILSPGSRIMKKKAKTFEKPIVSNIPFSERKHQEDKLCKESMQETNLRKSQMSPSSTSEWNDGKVVELNKDDSAEETFVQRASLRGPETSILCNPLNRKKSTKRVVISSIDEDDISKFIYKGDDSSCQKSNNSDFSFELSPRISDRRRSSSHVTLTSTGLMKTASYEALEELRESLIQNHITLDIKGSNISGSTVRKSLPITMQYHTAKRVDIPSEDITWKKCGSAITKGDNLVLSSGRTSPSSGKQSSDEQVAYIAKELTHRLCLSGLNTLKWKRIFIIKSAPTTPMARKVIKHRARYTMCYSDLHRKTPWISEMRLRSELLFKGLQDNKSLNKLCSIPTFHMSVVTPIVLEKELGVELATGRRNQSFRHSDRASIDGRILSESSCDSPTFNTYGDSLEKVHEMLKNDKTEHIVDKELFHSVDSYASNNLINQSRVIIANNAQVDFPEKPLNIYPMKTITKNNISYSTETPKSKESLTDSNSSDSNLHSLRDFCDNKYDFIPFDKKNKKSISPKTGSDYNKLSCIEFQTARPNINLSSTNYLFKDHKEDTKEGYSTLSTDIDMVKTNIVQRKSLSFDTDFLTKKSKTESLSTDSLGSGSIDYLEGDLCNLQELETDRSPTTASSSNKNLDPDCAFDDIPLFHPQYNDHKVKNIVKVKVTEYPIGLRYILPGRQDFNCPICRARKFPKFDSGCTSCQERRELVLSVTQKAIKAAKIERSAKVINLLHVLEQRKTELPLFRNFVVKIQKPTLKSSICQLTWRNCAIRFQLEHDIEIVPQKIIVSVPMNIPPLNRDELKDMRSVVMRDTLRFEVEEENIAEEQQFRIDCYERFRGGNMATDPIEEDIYEDFCVLGFSGSTEI